MSIQDEIGRIKDNIDNAYGAVDAMGGDVPDTPNSDNLAPSILTIPQAGGAFNLIINGNLDQDCWQRGASATSPSGGGYPAADRYRLSAGTMTRREFPIGQDGMPNDTRFCMEVAVAAGAVLEQRIEGVERLSGGKAVFSFWLRTVSGTGRARINFRQQFGTGGSFGVNGRDTDNQIFNINTTWQEFIFEVDVPHVALLSIGANNYVSAMVTFLDAGTYQTTRWNVPKNRIYRPIQPKFNFVEFAMCQRYCEITQGFFHSAPVSALNYVFVSAPFRVRKRVVPIIQHSMLSGVAVSVNTTVDRTQFMGSEFYIVVGVLADAEL